MNKKIAAVFCIAILMVSIFTACGNKGYLLAKDENGYEHAYVTDKEGNTVLNEHGEVRVYVTDSNGKIAKDEDGKPKENSVKKPEYEAKDDKYETDDFVLKITGGWDNATKGRYIKSDNAECYIEISKGYDDFEDGDKALENKLKEEIELNEQIMNNIKAQYPEASFKHGYKEVCGINMYVYEYHIETEDKDNNFNSTVLYFAVGKNVYCVSCTDNNRKDNSAGLDFYSYIEKNLTIKSK